MCLFSWDYTINHNENDEEQIIRYDINLPRSSHQQKYSKYKKCHSKMMLICIKQQLSNIWSSIYEKVREHGCLVKKEHCL